MKFIISFRFTCSLMYWALSFNTGSLSGNIYLNTFLLGIVELPALLLSYYCMGWPRLGRRLTCGFALLVAAASSFLTIPFIVVGRYSFHYHWLVFNLLSLVAIHLIVVGRYLFVHYHW